MKKNYNFDNLPKVFGIKQSNHPRWKEYIRIMNKKFGCTLEGDCFESYYGIDKWNDFDQWAQLDHHFSGSELTLDEFFNLIEKRVEIANYEIY
jgi:hypothetical protein